MNQEWKAKWIEALRSGKYKQGKYCLAQVDNNDQKQSYCCLGVLCEISGKNYDEHQLGLPLNVQDLTELSFLPTVNSPEVEEIKCLFQKKVSLSALNDSFNYSFEQIADLIEVNL